VETVTAAFAPDPRSARAARRFVERTLEAWNLTGAIEVVSLLTSELVANAVLHAGTPLELHLGVVGRRIRVQVRDRSAANASPRHDGAEATGGRGLRLVERLSDDWGVAEEGDGKTVWFALTA